MIHKLANLDLDQVKAKFGGKAHGLFEAIQMGLPVPEAWAIPIEAYQAFLESGAKDAVAWLKERVDLEALPNVLFAVRSSALGEDALDHSFAGIFETELFVPKEEIGAAIAKVWESASSTRVQSYTGDEPIAMGVIIQPMVGGRVTGIAFTTHPSPSNLFENGEIVIEYAQEEGEKVVQGEVTPFRLSGNVDELLVAGDLPWLPDLIETLETLQKTHGYDLDIEFAVDGDNTFWLLQQRPISKVYPSDLLDLTPFERKYKRSLLTLDIEMLIEGCSRFLAPYFELPLHLDRWMVMTTDEKGIQELWIHRGLEGEILRQLSDKLQKRPNYEERILEKYARQHEKICDFDFSSLLDKNHPLKERFETFYETVLPLSAHYYSPMYMLDALHGLILEEMKKIDHENAEADLFFLGTYNIETLMEILVKKLKEGEDRDKLAASYGFLKCHQVDEKGYRPDELFELLEEDQPKQDDKEHYEALIDKYQEALSPHFEPFREWMRIRNQDMEYLYYFYEKARPLFEEMAKALNLEVREVWDHSLASLRKGLEGEAMPSPSGAIFRTQGTIYVDRPVRVARPMLEKGEGIVGKTVYGTGKETFVVKVAFSPKELEGFKPEKPTVLVTGMTTPDFIPFLKENFKALVTDEGGILCHAAIVAREIPLFCIVGTGIASETLHDGQEVTIDFDRGRVDAQALPR